MKKNGAVDIICKIISVLLSIVLVVSLIVTVLFASVNNLLQPEAIVKMLSDVAGSSLIEKSPDLVKTNNLMFTPIVMMGGSSYKVQQKAETTYDEAYEVEAPDSQPPSNVYYYDENNVITTIKGEFGNASEIYVDENGNFVTDGKVVGSVGGKIEGNVSFNVVGNEQKPQEEQTESSSVAESQGSGGLEDFSMNDAKDMAMAFLESDTGKEIIGEYTEAVTDVLQGGTGEIDKEKIKEIIVENKDEIFDFVEEYTGQSFDRETAGAMVDKILEENIDSIMDQLPQPKELIKELPQELIQILSIINNKNILKALITLDIILVALIFVLRLWNFKGFLWLSIDGIVAGALLGIVFIALNLLKGIALTAAGQFTTVIEAVIGTVLSKILLGMAIIFVVAIVLMVVYFIIENCNKKTVK